MPDPRALVIALLAECHRLDDGAGIPGGWPLWADLSERMRRVYVEAMGNVLAKDGAVTDAAESARAIAERSAREAAEAERDRLWTWKREAIEFADSQTARMVAIGREEYETPAATAERIAADLVAARAATQVAEQRAEEAEAECERLRATATEAVADITAGLAEVDSRHGHRRAIARMALTGATERLRAALNAKETDHG